MTFPLPSPLSLLKLPVVLLATAKKYTKRKNARAERAKLLLLPTVMQICDILVAVAVVVSLSSLLSRSVP